MSGQPLKRVLYLGLEAPSAKDGEEIVHLPLIRIVPRSFSDSLIVEFYRHIPLYSHAVFTSKTAVNVFFDYLPHFGYDLSDLQHIKTAAVGKATAACLAERGVTAMYVAQQETAEGLCQRLEKEIHAGDHVCWPHSALSRNVLVDFFNERRCKYSACVFYETHFIRPQTFPSLDEVDEIVFTSPSTVDSFLCLYGQIPWHRKLTTLGPITKKQLFLLRD